MKDNPRPTEPRSFRSIGRSFRNSCCLTGLWFRPRSRVRPGGRVRTRAGANPLSFGRRTMADPRTRSSGRGFLGLGVREKLPRGGRDPRPFARTSLAASRCAPRTPRPRRRRSRASDPSVANRGSRERASSGPRRARGGETRRGSVYSPRSRGARVEMAPELVHHVHGKKRVRVARTWREGDTHHFVEWMVEVIIESDMAHAYKTHSNEDDDDGHDEEPVLRRLAKRPIAVLAGNLLRRAREAVHRLLPAHLRGGGAARGGRPGRAPR